MNRENAYQRLAPLYEELCDDCDYENWSQYFVMLLCGALHTEENNIAGQKACFPQMPRKNAICLINKRPPSR